MVITSSGAIMGKRSVRLSRSARLLPMPSSLSDGVAELVLPALTEPSPPPPPIELRYVAVETLFA